MKKSLEEGNKPFVQKQQMSYVLPKLRKITKGLWFRNQERKPKTSKGLLKSKTSKKIYLIEINLHISQSNYLMLSWKFQLKTNQVNY